ncbi:unnamed protein product [Cylicostephanus goldi]|uniref:Uncharacterized protein n=1 Tax=Cylicostephanus goldi TaxID=71465 RepID=A0A3P6R8E8_CYLGO|nr:unnamed protein product [Cylicostephanus goldi]
MNALSLLFLLCVAIAAVSGAIRAKRQRTVIERTVIQRGGPAFNRQPQPWGYGPGGFRGGWGQPNPLAFNRGPFGKPLSRIKEIF